MPSKTTKTVAAASALLGLGGAATLLTISPASAAPVTETFEFSGEAADFVVPEGICTVTVDAYGAEGGIGSDGNVAGLGGHTTSTLEVTPGETLVVTVGGQGGEGLSDEFAAEGVVGNGGFNGGGDGGNGPNQDPGGGGGGASDVRQGGAGLDARVVVAGGGGGSGGDSAEVDAPADEEPVAIEGRPPADRGAGGAGGGTTGEDGRDSGYGSGGGGGGTQTAGGSAGMPDTSSTAGTLGEGGNGGTGDSGKGFNDAGGGGGGGLYGGGGGSGDAFFDIPSSPTEGFSSTSDGGGGGGGSGFGPEGTTFETGVQEGNGLVTITYDTEAGGCDPDVLPEDTTPPPVVAGRPAFTG